MKNINNVKSIKIDTYLESNNLKADFVKIDVEGFELKALKGFKKNMINTKYIMIEHHNDNLYMGFNKDEVNKFLRKNNFELYFSLKFPLMNWEDRLYVNKTII